MDTTKYYWSNYNYIFTIKTGEHLIYNSYSNVFIEIDDEAKESLENLKIKIDNNKYKGDHPIHERLIETSIITLVSHLDVLNLLKVQRLTSQLINNQVSYTILPTMDCNFNCSYCFENFNPKQNISAEVENEIVRTIVTKNKNNSINITWFGGEPLLAFDKIINITKRIKEEDIKLSANIVTNGYLLTEDVVDKFSELNITSVQVTIDGIEEDHNKRRPHKSKTDSYSKIIRNLNYIHNKYIDKIGVSIRVNIDKTNKNKYKSIYDTLNDLYPNFIIYPGIVIESTACNSINNCVFNKEDLVDFIVENKNLYDFDVMPMFPKNNNSVCMAERLNDFVIGTEGELYKCWTDVGDKNKTVGNLLSKKINTKETVLHARYLTGCNPYEDQKCISCFMLPQCSGGGCTYKRMQKKYLKANINYCSYFKNNLNTFLEYHYNDKLQHKKEEWNY